MKNIEVAPGIYWVGAIDWHIRDFHGYSTNRGTTYNAYLIIDDKITLIDTVKEPFRSEMMHRIRICQNAGVPITNYGVILAHMQGILPRVSAPLLGKS